MSRIQAATTRRTKRKKNDGKNRKITLTGWRRTFQMRRMTRTPMWTHPHHLPPKTMPNDKSPPKPKDVTQQETGGDCVSHLVRFSITSCGNCPFYAHKYCKLSQRLNAQYGTDYPIFVVNEWRQGVTPARCPLRDSDMFFSLANSQADPSGTDRV